MKKLLILLLLASPLFAYDAPLNTFETMDNPQAVGALNDTISDLYRSKVGVSGNQAIAGSKTFKNAITFGDGSKQSTAYTVYTSSKVKIVSVGNISTTATAFGLAVNGSTLTFTTQGNTRILFGASCSCFCSANSINCDLTMYLDGINYGGSGGLSQAA